MRDVLYGLTNYNNIANLRYASDRVSHVSVSSDINSP